MKELDNDYLKTTSREKLIAHIRNLENLNRKTQNVINNFIYENKKIWE